MVTEGYGFAIDDIDWSCPADLEPYNKAYQMKMKSVDSYIHNAVGIYYISALSTVLEHSISKHPKSEYVKEPFMEELGLTEEQKVQKILDKYVQEIEEQKKRWDSTHN